MPLRADIVAAVTAILVAAAGLVVIMDVMGINTAIKGSYVLIASLIAVVIYFGSESENEPWTLSEANTTKLVLSIGLLACIVVQVIAQRGIILVLTLPIGYYAVIARTRSINLSIPHTIFQLMILFAIPLLTLFIQTGVYFGNLDLLKHGLFIDQLFQSGSIYAISSDYQFYPGLHILVGSLSAISGLSTNTSLLLTGITVYTTVGVALFYLLHRQGFNRRTALFTTIAGTALIQPTYYALYFYPQSFTVILLLLALYVSTRPDTTNRYSVIGWLTVFAAVISHHFSFILFAPIILLIPLLLKLTDTTTHRTAIAVISLFFTGWLIAVSYWLIVTETFVTKFVVFTIGVFSTVSPNSAAPAERTFRYDVPLEAESVADAVASLASADGLFYIAMAALVITAVLVCIRRFSADRTFHPFIIIGAFGSFILLKIPVTVTSLTRLQHPFAFFAAGFFGLAVNHGLSRENWLQRSVTTLLIVALCVTGPIVAAEDITSQEHPQQYQFTDTENQQLERMCAFLARGDTVTTFAATRNGLQAHGCVVDGYADLSDKGITHQAGLFVYQERWPEFRLSMFTDPVYSYQVVMSKQWLSSSVRDSNKVYGNGFVGATWSGDDSTLFNGLNSTGVDQ